MRRQPGGAGRGARGPGRRRLRADRELGRGRRARGAGRAAARPAAGDRPGGDRGRRSSRCWSGPAPRSPTCAPSPRTPTASRRPGSGSPRNLPARRGVAVHLDRRGRRPGGPRRGRRGRGGPDRRRRARAGGAGRRRRRQPGGGHPVRAGRPARPAARADRPRPHHVRRHHPEPPRHAARPAHRAGGARHRPDPHRVPPDQGPARRVLVPHRLHRAHQRAGDGGGAGRAAPPLRPGALPGLLPAGRQRRHRPARPPRSRSGRTDAAVFAAAQELAGRACAPGAWRERRSAGAGPARPDRSQRASARSTRGRPARRSTTSGTRRPRRWAAGWPRSRSPRCTPPGRSAPSRPPPRSPSRTTCRSPCSTACRRCSAATWRAARDLPAREEFDRTYAAWWQGDLDAHLPGGESAHDLRDRFVPVRRAGHRAARPGRSCWSATARRSGWPRRRCSATPRRPATCPTRAWSS